MKTENSPGIEVESVLLILHLPLSSVHSDPEECCAILSGPPKVHSIPGVLCQVSDSFTRLLFLLKPVVTGIELLYWQSWQKTGGKNEGGEKSTSCILTGKLPSAFDILKLKSGKCRLSWWRFACRPAIGGVSSLSFGCCSLINCYFCQCGGRTHTWVFGGDYGPCQLVNFIDYKERRGWATVIFIGSEKLPVFKWDRENRRALPNFSLAISVSLAITKLIWAGLRLRHQ